MSLPASSYLVSKTQRMQSQCSLSGCHGGLEHALLRVSGGVHLRLLPLGPLGHLLQLLLPGLLVGLVPLVEGLLRLRLGLEHAQEELCAKGVNSLRLVELVCNTELVLEGLLLVGWHLTKVGQELLAQGGKWLLGDLRELWPKRLDHISLGLAALLHAVVELCLSPGILLNLVEGLHVCLNHLCPLARKLLLLVEARVRLGHLIGHLCVLLHLLDKHLRDHHLAGWLLGVLQLCLDLLLQLWAQITKHAADIAGNIARDINLDGV
mmetsp:Transcript_61147/g.113488  ORF Transcript_61147/g.113488 Transcript_61147/m.113488 type:complete len:265 (-) Transcript_61147:611-1405(-)